MDPLPNYLTDCGHHLYYYGELVVRVVEESKKKAFERTLGV